MCLFKEKFSFQGFLHLLGQFSVHPAEGYFWLRLDLKLHSYGMLIIGRQTCYYFERKLQKASNPEVVPTLFGWILEASS